MHLAAPLAARLAGQKSPSSYLDLALLFHQRVEHGLVDHLLHRCIDKAEYKGRLDNAVIFFQLMSQTLDWLLVIGGDAEFQSRGIVLVLNIDQIFRIERELRQSQITLQGFLFIDSVNFVFDQAAERELLLLQVQEEELLVYRIRYLKDEDLALFVVCRYQVHGNLCVVLIRLCAHDDLALLSLIQFEVSEVFDYYIIEGAPFEAGLPNRCIDMCIHEFLDLAALDLVLFQEVGGILLLIGFQSLYFRKAVFLVEQTLQDRDFIHHVWISAVLQRIDKISILLAYQVERAAFHQRSIVVALIVLLEFNFLVVRSFYLSHHDHHVEQNRL